MAYGRPPSYGRIPKISSPGGSLRPLPGVKSTWPSQPEPVNPRPSQGNIDDPYLGLDSQDMADYVKAQDQRIMDWVYSGRNAPKSDNPFLTKFRDTELDVDRLLGAEVDYPIYGAGPGGNYATPTNQRTNIGTVLANQLARTADEYGIEVDELLSYMDPSYDPFMGPSSYINSFLGSRFSTVGDWVDYANLYGGNVPNLLSENFASTHRSALEKMLADKENEEKINAQIAQLTDFLMNMQNGSGQPNVGSGVNFDVLGAVQSLYGLDEELV